MRHRTNSLLPELSALTTRHPQQFLSPPPGQEYTNFHTEPDDFSDTYFSMKR